MRKIAALISCAMLLVAFGCQAKSPSASDHKPMACACGQCKTCGKAGMAGKPTSHPARAVAATSPARTCGCGM